MTSFVNPHYIFNPVPESEEITLSPTQIMKAMVCTRLLGYYRARVTPQATPLNLLFGTALHWVIEGFIKGYISDDEMANSFMSKFDESSSGKLICMAKSKSRETAEVIGKQLASGFPAYFRNLGLKPLIIEGEFRIKIADRVFIKLVIDFVGECTRPIFDPNGKMLADVGDVVILDWKTAAQPEGKMFARYSLQLTYYWLAVKLACAQLGIKEPKLCGFASGRKPNISKPDSEQVVNAIWHPVTWVKRTAADIEEALDFARVVAKRLRAGEFFRAPHMAYDSPCESQSKRCDMADVCLEGCLSGYSVKNGLTLADLI
ncbi:PD-(D/E)XK nuclease family protein [Pseudomonas sp. NY15437]|uniref:PD-(D/E)XK nuclease family protein n=1 Tax=Pseudomonas sp. NY15437 TaxID=3400360 RepID=UPI003A87B62C